MSEIDQISLEVLQNWVEGGRTEVLPEEAQQYLVELEVVRGLHQRWQSKSAVIKVLKQKPYELSDYIAQKRYSDAINFFYLDTQIKKDAYRNLYAEKLEQLATATTLAATAPKDFALAAKIFMDAYKARGLDQPDNEDLPPEIYERVVRVYTNNATKLGLPRANRNELGRFIDDLDISEVEKIGLKQDAEVLEPKLFKDETEGRGE